jgi:hypothetical protein
MIGAKKHMECSWSDWGWDRALDDLRKTPRPYRSSAAWGIAWLVSCEKKKSFLVRVDPDVA